MRGDVGPKSSKFGPDPKIPNLDLGNLVFAEDRPVVSADKTSVVSACKTAVVAADTTSAAAADKTSVVSQDICKVLWTQGWPLRGRPCVDNEVGMSGETTDVLSAAAADVLSANTTDVLPAGTTDTFLSADTRGLSSANGRTPWPRERWRQVQGGGKSKAATSPRR